MSQTDKTDREEQDISRLLQAAGRREKLPEDLKQRWQQTFQEELAPVVQRRQQQRRYFNLSIAAGFAVLSLAALFSWLVPPSAAVDIAVAKVVGNNQLLREAESTKILRTGQHLLLESTIITEPGGYAAIEYRGYDLRLNSTTRVQFLSSGIRLEAGEIYINGKVPSAKAQGMTVITPFGDIRDIGTQFSVALQSDRVVSRVRRGSILVSTKTGQDQHRADASPGNAHEISLDHKQQIRVASIAASGPAWEWIFATSAEFQVQGKTVFEFLQWSTLETGLSLEFADESAAIHAHTIYLSGDISELSPSQAVDAVLATTSLRAEQRRAKTLRIYRLPRD